MAAPHGRHMLLLALTGYGATNDPQRSTQRGFDYHLVKPLDADRLTRVITMGVTAA